MSNDNAAYVNQHDDSDQDTGLTSQISSVIDDSKSKPLNHVYSEIEKKLTVAQNTFSPANQHWQKIKKPRFEIELYEEVTNDESGEITGYKKVQSEYPIIIEAANRADLDEHAQRYKLCHQRMKIIRKLDDGDSQPAPDNQQAEKELRSPYAQVQCASSEKLSDQSQSKDLIQRQKPKFYKIGDLEIKDDNGKIYQKQWMKLSDNEMTNFRVISDKNNSIVNLNGKHLEMKKWVLVEKSDDESTTLEDGLSDSK